MDPSRIRLEDDRFGLIGAAFRPGNRAVFVGRTGEDYVWSIGIVVAPEDDIQTVEIDDHGAKSSRMLSSGELFEGLDILAAPGTEAFIIAGTFTLMGMELSATDRETTHEFAELLRSAADDHSWRLPLHVVGHPRDLQLSAQGRDILRETAATLERDGTATTSLAAARRLELSEQALDSIRRRISRTSLQAYRMHGRWYVVLDNLARSRTTPSAVEAAPEPAEAPETAEQAPTAVAAEMPETQPAPSEAPTEDDLAAFAEPEVEAQPEPAPPVEPEPPTEPSVEYVPEEPVEAEAAPIAAAETGEPEPAEAEIETTVAGIDEMTELESEEAIVEFEEPVAEAVTDEALPAEAEIEEAPVTEPEATEEYRVAATTAGPAVQPDEEFAEPEADASEQASEASVEELAAMSVEESEAEKPEAEQPLEEAAATIEEPVVAEDMAALEEMEREQPAADVEALIEPEVTAEEAVAEPSVDGEAPEAEPAAEPEIFAEEPGEDEVTAEAEAPSEEISEPEVDLTTLSETETVAEAPDVAEEPEPSVEPEAAEVRSEEALLFAEMVEQETTEEPSATELESDVAEQSDQLIAERIGEPTAAGIDEADAEPEADIAAGEGAGEPSDEMIAEAVRTHAPAYADEVGQDEVLETEPAAKTTEEPEAPEPTEAPEEAEARGEAPETEAEPSGGPSAASYFADARRESAPPIPPAIAIDFATHLRGEVAFLRQQSREKDRQIGVWGDGAKWLQPFVDQIRSLEKQVERLGELHVQRENERVNDLISERDMLRERLAKLEEQISSAQAGDQRRPETNRRSWFRRLMGSE